MINRFLVFLILPLLVFCCAGNSFAKTSFKPRLSLSETYNDNIFLENKNNESDYITALTPGIDLYFDSNYLNLNIDYSLHFIKYKDHPDEDETEFRNIQRALVDLLVFPEKDFTILLKEEISRVVIDDRQQTVAENELVNMSTLYHFMANPQYQWRVFPTFQAIVGYQFDNYDYVDSDGDDAETHRYRLGLVKELVTETKIRITGFREDYSVENRSSFQLQQATGGLTQMIGPLWQFDADGGFAKVDFDTDPDVEDSIWAVSLTGQVSKHMQLLLATNRAFYVSVNAGLTNRTQASTALHYQDLFDVELRAYWKEDRYQTEDRTDRAYGVAFKNRIPLSRKFVLTIKGDVVHYEFLPLVENVVRIGAGASVEYVGRRISLSLGYTFRESDSDIDPNDYTNNIATVSASLRF